MSEFYKKFKKEGGNVKKEDRNGKGTVRGKTRRKAERVKDNGLGIDMESILNAPYVPVANTVVIRTLRATITHLSKLNHVYKHTLFNSRIPFPVEVKSSEDHEKLRESAWEFLSYLFSEFGAFKSNSIFVPTLGLRSEIKKIIKDTEVEEGDSYREREGFFTNGVLNLVESEMFDQLIIGYPEDATKDAKTIKQHLERLSNYIKQIVDPIVLSRATRIRDAVIDVVKKICMAENITFPPITPKQKALIISSWNIPEEDAGQLNKIQASHLINALLKKNMEQNNREEESNLFRER